MSEESLVYHCAPTLAGLKTGSLFTCPYSSESEIRGEIRYFNRMLVPKGLRILPLRYARGRALIYLYRPARLQQDFSTDGREELLRERGYTDTDATKCIIQLMNRLKCAEEFPHEIGLFLGYPIEDVKGFIENRAGHCSYTGYWKVYGDVKEAKRLFASYKKCTDIYCDQWSRGKSVAQLAVAGKMP